MQRTTSTTSRSFRSSASRRRSGAPPGIFSRRPIRLIVFLTQLVVALLISSAGARAQLVVDGSFEGVNTALLPIAGWSYGGMRGVPYAIPGCLPGSWYTYYGSPDIFWGLGGVYNFMADFGGRTPFHGDNYAGVSTGTFTGGFGSEILVGTLSPATTAGMVEVRARFAMGTARGNPCRVQVKLFNSAVSGSDIIVGTMLVTNREWNLFSQSITVPAGYDRIGIEGILDADPRNNYGAYFFIDSVDVTPVPGTPCSFLGAHAEYLPNPSGTGCCWRLFIDNHMPTWMTQLYHVRITGVPPNPLSGPVTPATGFIAGGSTWSTATGGAFPIGTSENLGTYCVNVNTTPQLQIIEFLGPANQVLCTDSIWTNCEQVPTPCMDLSILNLACGPLDTAGHRTYTFTIGMNVFHTIPGYVHFSSPQGTLSWPNQWVPGYSYPVPETFTDIPPVDGHICIYAEHHAMISGRDSIICTDTVCTDLPQCPEDCCKNFTKSFSQMKVSVVNSNVNIGGCLSVGPNQIKRFSATIVAAQLRTKCGTAPAGAWQRIFGDITAGTLGASLGAPQFVPTMAYSREIVWGGAAYPVCVPFTPCVPFSLKTIFPNPPGLRGCVDSLRFAIRYTFTDCNCVTCDTLVWYQVARTYLPIVVDGSTTTTTTTGDGTLSTTHMHPDAGLLNITMTTSTAGTLAVTLPSQQSANEPAIRIVGMTFRPEGVPLLALTEHGTANNATIFGNTGTIAYTLDPGQTKLFDVSIANDDAVQRYRSIMLFRYVMVGDTANPPDTTTTDTLEVFGNMPSAGGDVVETTQSALQDVRTYALHMVASNALSASVNALRVHVNGGATLIAVGPTGNGTDAVISSGADRDGNTVVQVDKDTWTVENVQAGTTLDPIYLTFAGVGNNTVSVDYATLNDDGSAMSSGTATISSPLRVAGVGNESAETGETLMPIYPNPAAHSATAQFNLRSAGHVSVTVRDVRGNEVLRLIDGEQFGAGEHLVPFDTQALPAGTYVVIVNVDGRTLTRPLTIVR